MCIHPLHVKFVVAIIHVARTAVIFGRWIEADMAGDLEILISIYYVARNSYVYCTLPRQPAQQQPPFFFLFSAKQVKCGDPYVAKTEFSHRSKTHRSLKSRAGALARRRWAVEGRWDCILF